MACSDSAPRRKGDSVVDSSDERFTIVLDCRVEGRARYLLASIDFSRDDFDLVEGDRDAILAFTSPDEARAYARQRFPDPGGDLGTIRRGLEEMYGVQMIGYDLDRAAAWATQPAPETAGPELLLTAWRLLASAGVAPDPGQFDPMGFAGLYMPSGRPPTGREALMATAMKLDGMVRERDRREQRGEAAEGEDTWPDLGEVWDAGDVERVAAVLRDAIPAFAARVKHMT